MYIWQLARDSSVDKYASIHNHFLEKRIGALTYDSEKAWLFSAAKSRLYTTDMVKQMDAGDFIQVVQSPQIEKVNKNRRAILFPSHLIL